MGFSDLDYIISLKKLRHLPQKGAVIDVGAQQLANSALDPGLIRRFGNAFGFRAPQPVFASRPTVVDAESGYDNLAPDAPLIRELWNWVEWSYSAIDVDGSPSSIPLDLNFDEVPDALQGKFNLVTNYGTTEHIANQFLAFRAIHDLAAVGGVMIHYVPSQGLPNHGLVNYNPKFFWRLARSNGYKPLRLELVPSGPESAYSVPENIAPIVVCLDPEVKDRAETYKLVDAMLCVCFTKLRDAPFVPPLDIPDNAEVTDPLMRKRYWTLFGDREPL